MLYLIATCIFQFVCGGKISSSNYNNYFFFAWDLKGTKIAQGPTSALRLTAVLVLFYTLYAIGHKTSTVNERNTD